LLRLPFVTSHEDKPIWRRNMVGHWPAEREIKRLRINKKRRNSHFLLFLPFTVMFTHLLLCWPSLYGCPFKRFVFTIERYHWNHRFWNTHAQKIKSESRIMIYKAIWLFCDLFWTLLKWASFLRQLGSCESFLEPKTKPLWTILRFFKSAKHSVMGSLLSFICQFFAT